MIADLIAIGLFATTHYDTPPSRVVALKLARQDVKLPDKYAGELLDYRIDWSTRLDGDVIVGATVVVTSGVAVPSRLIFDETTASFWVGGGRSGNGSLVKCLVQTAGGRSIEQVFILRCL